MAREVERRRQREQERAARETERRQQREKQEAVREVKQQRQREQEEAEIIKERQTVQPAMRVGFCRYFGKTCESVYWQHCEWVSRQESTNKALLRREKCRESEGREGRESGGE